MKLVAHITHFSIDNPVFYRSMRLTHYLRSSILLRICIVHKANFFETKTLTLRSFKTLRRNVNINNSNNLAKIITLKLHFNYLVLSQNNVTYSYFSSLCRDSLIKFNILKSKPLKEKPIKETTMFDRFIVSHAKSWVCVLFLDQKDNSTLINWKCYQRVCWYFSILFALFS